jgi:predicted lactoylglutathione lyase/ketosteroid isomerase-like protein
LPDQDLAEPWSGLSKTNEKGKAMIIDHIYLPVSDLNRSSEFFKKMLEPLGIDMAYKFERVLGFAINGEPGFWLKNGVVAKDLYVAFPAKSADAVRTSYKAAIDAGATSKKEPSLRPEWRADYFAANICDPDGYNIEIAYKPWLYKSVSNVDLVRNIDIAYQAGPDSPLWESFLSTHSEDVKVLWPGRPQPTVGLHKHDVDCREFLTAFDNRLATNPYKILFGEGDYTCSVVDWTVTMKGPTRGADGKMVPPTGKTARLELCFVTTWKDGKILEERIFYDAGELMRQLGLLEQQEKRAS